MLFSLCESLFSNYRNIHFINNKLWYNKYVLNAFNALNILLRSDSMDSEPLPEIRKQNNLVRKPYLSLCLP